MFGRAASLDAREGASVCDALVGVYVIPRARPNRFASSLLLTPLVASSPFSSHAEFRI